MGAGSDWDAGKGQPARSLLINVKASAFHAGLRKRIAGVVQTPAIERRDYLPGFGFGTQLQESPSPHTHMRSSSAISWAGAFFRWAFHIAVTKGSNVVVPLSGRLCLDRKSTRLNSSHVEISYAVFCLKKKN